MQRYVVEGQGSLRAYVDQLHIYPLFQISVALVMIYVYTVNYLTSTGKIICKGILKNNKLKCDALIMVKFCLLSAWCTQTTLWSDKASLSFLLYRLTDCFRFWDISCEGCIPKVLLIFVFGAHCIYIIVHSLKLRWSLLNFCKWFVIYIYIKIRKGTQSVKIVAELFIFA